jgi:hypothetical protein
MFPFGSDQARRRISPERAERRRFCSYISASGFRKSDRASPPSEGEQGGADARSHGKLPTRMAIRSRDQDGVACGAADPPDGMLQDLIPYLVTVRVVERLELVEVQEEHTIPPSPRAGATAIDGRSAAL